MLDSFPVTSTYMFNNRRTGRKTRMCLLPRRCFLSGNRIWFKKCEVVTCMLTGPGEPIIETYWCDPKAFLINELKR